MKFITSRAFIHTTIEELKQELKPRLDDFKSRFKYFVIKLIK